MENIVKHGTQRKKVGTIELKGMLYSDVIAETLINQGYDLDVEPIFNDLQIKLGDKINVYEVRR